MIPYFFRSRDTAYEISLFRLIRANNDSTLIIELSSSVAAVDRKLPSNSVSAWILLSVDAQSDSMVVHTGQFRQNSDMTVSLPLRLLGFFTAVGGISTMVVFPVVLSVIVVNMLVIPHHTLLPCLLHHPWLSLLKKA